MATFDDVMADTGDVFEALEAMVDTSRAEIVLVGYPFLSIDTEDYYLDRFADRTAPIIVDYYDAAGGVRAAGAAANQKQRELVADWNRDHQLKVTYVDGVSDRFAGHEPDPSALRRNEFRWLNEFLETEGIQVGDRPTQSKGSRTSNEWYHPNITGHEQIAEQVKSTLGVPRQARGGIWGAGAVDIVFVVDMGYGYPPGGWQNIDEVVDRYARTADGRRRSARFGVVEFRGFDHTLGDMDEGRAPTEGSVALDFTYSAELAGGVLDGLDPSDGGRIYWEPSTHTGLMTALGMNWRSGVRKVVLLLTTEDLDPREAFSDYDLAALQREALRVDPVEIYGIDLGALDCDEMRQLAQGTNGLVLDGTDGKLAEAVDQAIAAALDNPLAWIQGPYVVKSGEELTLDAGGSYSPYGGITAYEWDFEGDGIWDQTTDSWTVTHRFDEEFDGVVGVRVTDARGRRAIGSTQLLVTDDGDSAARDVDNCPDVYNWGQEDSDGDGVGDECDATPGAAIWEPADDGAVFTKAQVEALTQTGSPSNPEPSAPVGPEPSIAPSGSQGDGSREPSAPAAVPSAGATGVVSASQSSSPAPAGSRASGQDGSPGPSGADGPVSAGPLPLTGALSPGWLPASVAASLIFGALLVVFRRRRARQGLMGG